MTQLIFCVLLVLEMNSSFVTLHSGYLDVKIKGRLGDVSNNIVQIVLMYFTLPLCVTMLALSPTLHLTSKQCNARKEMARGEGAQ